MKELLFCSNCVMDGSALEMNLDEKGVCNFCHEAQRELKLAEDEKPNLALRIAQIKKDGKGKKYDCLVGLSGGADSSTALHHAVSLGLRPLCFSVDNGYNRDSESDENILKLVEGLKVPFYRYVVDLVKFRELQSAFLKAGLINVEATTDHILMAATYEMASKYDINWVISGGNVVTESIMPRSWSYPARDLKHIKGVYETFTGKKLKGLPVCGIWKFNWYKWIKGIRTFYLLDYLDYNREDSIKMLQEKYGYVPYGEKHCESTFTWWFQNFYLFECKKIDKRKAHYSSLINSGQMTRREARIKLQENPVYPELGIENKVREYKHHEYFEYPNDEALWNFLCSLFRFGRRIKKIFT